MKSIFSRGLAILGLVTLLAAIPSLSEAALRTSAVGRILEAHRYAASHPSASTYSLVLYFDTNNDGATDQFFHTGPACGQQAATLTTFDQGKLLDAVASGLRARIDYLPTSAGGLTLNCIVGYSLLP